MPTSPSSQLPENASTLREDVPSSASPEASSRQGGSRQGEWPGWLTWSCILAIILLCVASPVPGINESHYLPKAKHALDSSFAPGDLFLESHDSHLLATYSAGILARGLPLSVVAWLGRLAAWALMAVAWMRLTRCLSIPDWLSPLTLASWYFAMEYGNWAGEWALGGFEGKSIAYPCVLLAIGAAMLDRWNSSWLWSGLAVAWHPLVGGWAGLSLGLTWLIKGNLACWKNQVPWWLLAAGLALIGILPALAGIGGSDRDGNLSASQIHVYLRLSHHLCPLAFAPARHWAAVASLLAFTISTFWWLHTYRQQRNTDGFSSSRAEGHQVPLGRLGILICVAGISVVFALVGLTIDLLFSRPDGPIPQPLLASKLLRFYWFRWADAAVPLAWTLTVWTLSTRILLLKQVRPLPIRNPDTSLARQPVTDGASECGAFDRAFALAVASLASLITVACIGRQIRKDWRDSTPPADRLLVGTHGELRKISWEGTDSDRYTDWLAVCDWIRNHTPSDSLWLTPKHQQTFKWHAQRAEVVCWKDVPQDSPSVIEWYKRIVELEPPRNRRGQIRGWTDEELNELSRKYGFDYVLVDRTYYAQESPPPKLEILYPTDVDNRSFAVFRMLPRQEPIRKP